MLLCLLWSLVEVHSQTQYPYVSFMGKALPDHAYVDLRLVGNDDSGSDSVQCHTDLSTCTGAQGEHRGDWISGTEVRLPFSSNTSAGIYEIYQTLRVELHRRKNAGIPYGIYRCEIQTNAMQVDHDPSVKESVYVGLYASKGIM